MRDAAWDESSNIRIEILWKPILETFLDHVDLAETGDLRAQTFPFVHPFTGLQKQL